MDDDQVKRYEKELERKRHELHMHYAFVESYNKHTDFAVYKRMYLEERIKVLELNIQLARSRKIVQDE